MKTEIRQIITQLKNGSITIRDIPEEYKGNKDIVKAERKLGLRKIYRCGFDIISDKFFVDEELTIGEGNDRKPLSHVWFDDFTQYSAYLEGNIYKNACYYQVDTQRVPEGIDKERLLQYSSFIEIFKGRTIADYRLTLTEEEQEKYAEVERYKPLIKKWITKFNLCATLGDLKKTVQNYNKSTLKDIVDVSFYFWNYIFADVNDEIRFQIIMEYMSSGSYPEYRISGALCSIYDPDKVLENYKYELGAESTRRKHIIKLKRIAENVKSKKYIYRQKRYYDMKTHYFCVETGAFLEGQTFPSFSYNEFFETIEEFIERLKGDLRGCDLSWVQDVNFDFSKCTTNDKTKLPVNPNTHYNYEVKKGYASDRFYVIQKWTNKAGQTIKKYNHRFRYFCDFSYFLKGDLSKADLLSCNGLCNLRNTDGLVFQDALLTGSVCRKLGLPYEKYSLQAPDETSFSIAEANEEETALQADATKSLVNHNETSLPSTFSSLDSSEERIYYISDIHFCHLLKNRGVETKADVFLVVREVAETIESESGYHKIVLINGDTSFDPDVFKLFIKELHRIKRQSKSYIFTIGNHDIWSYCDNTYDEIVEKFRKMLGEYGMFLLQNDVLYIDADDSFQHITEDDLRQLDIQELRNKTRCAKLIFFGGTGFAGYNQLFNASIGLYANNHTIGYDRDFELAETRKIEQLYMKVCSAFYDKNVVVMTHMPLPDWFRYAWLRRENDYDNSKEGEREYFNDHPEDNLGTYTSYQPGFVYVSGHTHRNYYYDDGNVRIYADNQFGYNKSTPRKKLHLKSFDINMTYDIFSDYSDGIYEISADEYRDFYRGKNIFIEFNRAVNVLYMLKKKGYYCFIHKSKQNSLSILNGGALKRLDNKDIRFYYENMDIVLTTIKDPLDKYTSYQEAISNEIKKLGGYGTIHGCIIDIDFFNHIYVNPFDGTVTGYWASDIVNKLIYPTVPSLLEAQCPSLYEAYKKMISGDVKKNLPVLSGQTGSSLALKPVSYLDTDIYKASREIKKMQKLRSNVLSTWPADLPNQHKLDERSHGELPPAILD